MPSHRAEHGAESVMREITAIIREMKDPRLSDGFISVFKISPSKDRSSYRVFISAMEGIEKAEMAAKCLQSAEGHIRGELGRRLRLRYIPRMVFQPTDALEYGINFSKRIDEIIKQHPSGMDKNKTEE